MHMFYFFDITVTNYCIKDVFYEPDPFESVCVLKVQLFSLNLQFHISFITPSCCFTVKYLQRVKALS